MNEPLKSNTLLKTTVDIRVEVLHTANNTGLVGSLVVEGLHELIAKAPSTETGKFESKGGLDVSWATRVDKVDENGKPLLAAKPMAMAVNEAMAT